MTRHTTSDAPDLNQLLTLRQQLEKRTTAEVRFDSATRAMYASEASNYRQPPVGVVIPRTIDDFETTVKLCAEFGIAILPRGAGTSMCGQAVNAAICIDHSKYLHAIERIDAAASYAIVQPGVVCDQLKKAAAGHGLTFGPDPATHSRCTLGGMIGNNSCGAHSVMAGKTVENIERLEVLSATGARFWVGPTDDATYAEHLAAGGERARIVKGLRELAERYADDIRAGFPKLKRRVSGYNLDQLLPENGFNIARALVGSEGTLATTLRAQTSLVQGRHKRVLVVLGFDSIFDAADSVPHLLPLGAIAMEGLDQGIVGGLKELGLKLDDIAELPAGDAWLLVEFGARTRDEAIAQARAMANAAQRFPQRPSVRFVEDAALMNRLWTIRETGASATSLSLVPHAPDPVVGWEDAAVEPTMLGSYLREFTALVARYGYKTNLYGHFGDGCIHSRITFDLRSPKGITDWRAFLEEAAQLVVKYQGSLSGEHGDGQAKGEFLHLMYTPRLMQAFREFKALWDPHGLMNPGKLIDAMPVDANLRMGPQYRQGNVKGMFTYPMAAHGHASAAQATTGGALQERGYGRETERCIGMGKCRSMDGGTMCPSFKATREERNSTRGRARLFFEMLNGEVIDETRDAQAVKESMDMCLSCKGCKNDCPTHVDIPKYRAEFLHRYYKTRRRPLMDAAVGRIGAWLPVATRVSGLLNGVMRHPLVKKASRRFGLSENAPFPAIANRAFRDTAAAKKLIAPWPGRFGARDVVVWTDTFNNGFSPAVLEAALHVVEAAGGTARLTPRHVCCGRPLYDVGLLDEAKKNLLEIVEMMRAPVVTNVPVLILEPSCLSVFRDEMLALIGNDAEAGELARKLSASCITVADFAQKHGLKLPQPSPDGANAASAVHVHTHCHQRACGGAGAEKTIGANVLDTGCCGMAGAFGYHDKTATIAKAVGEKELVPKLRLLSDDAILVADGFSCRTQIGKLTGRKAQHLAQAIASAYSHGRADADDPA
ncbi:FAD-binding and (Fe-S)-binding domain-containing protein [Paraburkholderia sp. J63]|uniref:FAD-binding and (Fe-S)-binding domain-containing protein n=1 Tax=Paraburkholderia sp. J63 TaxID=2805434 RepID=UPI002ABDF823|nr:FAD-binding and (Fe-S)-binding domain-containing protein [Paraburkholderia sp. J63]